jgi:hypothetical protein
MATLSLQWSTAAAQPDSGEHPIATIDANIRQPTHFGGARPRQPD